MTRFICLVSMLYSLCLPTVASTCSAGVELQVLGAGGPEINDKRASSGYQIWLDGRSRVLLDAGSGTSYFFEQSDADFADIDTILFSHLHTDHSADLPALIKGSFFTTRQRDLLIIGPQSNTRMPSTSQFVTRLFGANGAFPYLSDYLLKGAQSYQIVTEDVPLENVKTTYERPFNWGKVSAISIKHGPIPALAWRVDIAGCSIVYSGDFSNKTQKFSAFAQDADLLLIHMAIAGNAGRIAKNLHVSPSQIVQIVADANPKQVLISHLMRRSEPQLPASLSSIKQVYSGKVTVARALLKVPVRQPDVLK